MNRVVASLSTRRLAAGATRRRMSSEPSRPPPPPPVHPEEPIHEAPGAFATVTAMGAGAFGAIFVAGVGVYGVFKLAFWVAGEAGRSIRPEERQAGVPAPQRSARA